METQTKKTVRGPGYSEHSRIDVEIEAVKPYSSYKDLIAITKDPFLVAVRKHDKKNGNDTGKNNDQFTFDQYGRPILSQESVDWLNEEQRVEVAVLEHGNDPDTRMDISGFPKSREYREKFLKSDYESEYPKAFKALNQGYWVFLYGPRGTRKNVNRLSPRLEVP